MARKEANGKEIFLYTVYRFISVEILWFRQCQTVCEIILRLSVKIAAFYSRNR